MELQLRQAKEDKQKMVEFAHEQIKNGDAPSEEVIKDWNRLEKRMKDMINKNEFKNDSMSNSMKQSSLCSERPNFVKTTAEARPTAYIPDDLLGLPIPYGNHAPFKPSTASASMRHIRNPIPLALEI
jgi:hypothetical protein